MPILSTAKKKIITNFNFINLHNIKFSTFVAASEEKLFRQSPFTALIDQVADVGRRSKRKMSDTNNFGFINLNNIKSSTFANAFAAASEEKLFRHSPFTALIDQVADVGRRSKRKMGDASGQHLHNINLASIEIRHSSLEESTLIDQVTDVGKRRKRIV